MAKHFAYVLELSCPKSAQHASIQVNVVYSDWPWLFKLSQAKVFHILILHLRTFN